MEYLKAFEEYHWKDHIEQMKMILSDAELEGLYVLGENRKYEGDIKIESKNLYITIDNRNKEVDKERFKTLVKEIIDRFNQLPINDIEFEMNYYRKGRLLRNFHKQVVIKDSHDFDDIKELHSMIIVVYDKKSFVDSRFWDYFGGD